MTWISGVGCGHKNSTFRVALWLFPKPQAFPGTNKRAASSLPEEDGGRCKPA
ncbi:MAG: hypothetical protein K2H63_08025 [Paramuribaculum sp.]|nr:hypothetical protein [Paramuribaculum sp.]